MDARKLIEFIVEKSKGESAICASQTLGFMDRFSSNAQLRQKEDKALAAKSKLEAYNEVMDKILELSQSK